MPYKKRISFQEQRLMQRIIAQEAELQRIFNEFIRRVSPYLKKYSLVNARQIWYRNSAIEKAIDRELTALHSDILKYMTSQGGMAWEMAGKNTDELIKDYIRGFSLSTTMKEGMFIRNLEALKQFQKRATEGFNLSQRVWKITESTKENIEYFVSSGITSGRSASEISKDVRQVLNNPDALFRRVRDPETGKLKPNRPMAAYHPGQGVYRSAYKNALRMSRTETNMAYRMADTVRWRQLDCITGYEVLLSGSHPTYDICDSMTGMYPKTFTFLGWHTSCYCYAVPILMPQDQFAKYLNTETVNKNLLVKGIPPGASRYISNNTAKLKNLSSAPYWLKDNFVTKNGKFVPKKGI